MLCNKRIENFLVIVKFDLLNGSLFLALRQSDAEAQAPQCPTPLKDGPDFLPQSTMSLNAEN